MKPNEKLKCQRTNLGYSEEIVANSGGVSVSEYSDLEAYEDEIFNVAHLGEIRKICNILDMSILDLIGLDSCRSADRNKLEDTLYTKRLEKGMSTLDVSDAVGIDESFVIHAEKDASSLDGWVIEPIRDYASVLEIPLACIISPHGDRG